MTFATARALSTIIYLIVLAFVVAILLAIYLFILVTGYILENLLGGPVVYVTLHGLSVISKMERSKSKWPSQISSCGRLFG